MNILADYRVIECASNIAGPYCGKLFADAGAEVIKVEAADGDPLRRRAVHGEELADRDAALFRFLNAGKTSLIGEPADDAVDDLLAHADVLVEDYLPARFDIDDLRRRFPALVVVSITPYGRRGSWANRPANDFIVQAESGTLAVRGDPDRPPFQVGGRLTEYIAGTYAAVAAIASAREAKKSGCGQWLDCASIESTNITFSVFTDLAASIAGIKEVSGPPRRVREYPSIEPTLDGWVGFNTNTAQMWESLLLMIGRSDLIDDPDWAVYHRMMRGEETTDMVRAFTTTKTTAEIVEEASRLRIPVAPVGDGQSVLEHPQFRERGFYVHAPDGDFVQPLPPYMINGERATPRGPAPQLGEHADPAARPASTPSRPPGRGPLAGLRVVDATAWWAGPSATQLLACMGAEVIHVESAKRMDGARTYAGGAMDGPWYERSSLWNGANTNKLDITLALDHPEGIAAFKRLIASADVVVENYSPRVFENFGLTWETIHDLNPRTIFMRMPAFGTTGPWRNNVGFAQTMEQLSGMAWLTGYPDGEPRIPLGPCDPNAGTHAIFGLLVAIVRRDLCGEGSCVEATMAEAALNAAAEQPIVYSAYGITMMRAGNRSPDAAPQGLYLCSDPGEKWLALSVETDDQWAALRRLVGDVEWASHGELDRREGRRRHHDRIDAGLSAWAKARHLADALAPLLAAGIPAGEVRDPRVMHTHPVLRERGYFVELDHPVLGRHPVPCPPFRAADAPDWLRSPAPLLGQDNWTILRSIGMADDEIQNLIEQGVAGTSP